MRAAPPSSLVPSWSGCGAAASAAVQSSTHALQDPVLSADLLSTRMVIIVAVLGWRVRNTSLEACPTTAMLQLDVVRAACMHQKCHLSSS
jgi:hypothetical protein